MNYRQPDVMQAFRLYTLLVEQGELTGADIEQYVMNDDVRGLLDLFVMEVDCVLIHASDVLYLVPLTSLSPFHLKNQVLRRELGATATNLDLYMMYFCMIIFIGEFYNSYQSLEVQREFFTLPDWLEKINERLDALREHPQEVLEQEEQDFEHNWLAIIEKWDALNDVKETAQKQKGKTISRMSFLYKVVNFMEEQKIIEEVGEEEYSLTEKAKIIVQRYFMELEYNQGILKFMYQYDEKKENENAINL